MASSARRSAGADRLPEYLLCPEDGHSHESQRHPAVLETDEAASLDALADLHVDALRSRLEGGAGNDGKAQARVAGGGSVVRLRVILPPSARSPEPACLPCASQGS